MQIKFKQIAISASTNNLYALDEDGFVWCRSDSGDRDWTYMQPPQVIEVLQSGLITGYERDVK